MDFVLFVILSTILFAHSVVNDLFYALLTLFNFQLKYIQLHFFIINTNTIQYQCTNTKATIPPFVENVIACYNVFK